MTSAQVLYDLNQTDIQYLISAHTIMTAPHTKRKRHLNIRFSLIAAAIVAIVMIPLTVIIANHYGITPPPIPVITTPEETYKSLTDIPGAVKVDPENGIAKEIETDLLSPQDKVLQMNNPANSRIFFVGTATYIESVIIPHKNEGYWTLMVFDVTVKKNIRNSQTGETVRILTCCYSPNDNEIHSTIRFYFPDHGMKLLKNPYAFFSLYPQLLDHGITPPINEIPVDLSLYADYCDTYVYETDGEGFDFFGSRIDFSEILPEFTE